MTTKPVIVAAFCLAAAVVFPASAFAGENGADYLNRMLKTRNGQVPLESQTVRPKLPPGTPSHRYQGSRTWHFGSSN